MTTLNALKELAAVIVGGGKTAADIPGTIVPDVIEYIAKNYPRDGTLIELTIASVAGSAIGTTKITVSPALTSGNSYAYKSSPSAIDAPEYYEIPTGLTTWDGKSDIEIEDSHHIGLYELNPDGRVVGFGDKIVAVNLG